MDRRLAEGQAWAREYALRLPSGIARSSLPKPVEASELPGVWLNRRIPRERVNGGGAIELVQRAKGGEPRAREELIRRLLPLVIRLARAYRTPGLELEDLIQEGIVGILRALVLYDPGVKTPFPAYAVWWIRYSLQDLRSSFVRPMRLPPKALRRLAEIKEAREQFRARESREATLKELSQQTGLPEAEIEVLLQADMQARSLDESLGYEPEMGTLGELLSDPLSEEMYEEVLSSVQATQLRALMTHLSERERRVLAARYGLDGEEGETLREVGKRLGVSAERVRQIENRALAKLRHGVLAPVPPVLADQ